MPDFSRTLRGAAFAGALVAAGSATAETPDNQLVVGFSMTNVLTLDPHAITGREAVQVLANVYDGLVELDAVERTKVKPDLAESWTVAPDGMSISFKLREGATFASGNPVRAADVVWSLKRLMKLNLAQASFLKTHGFSADNADASFSAPDERTVVVTLPKKTAPDLVVAALGVVGPGSVLDSALVEENAEGDDLGAKWLALNSAGSAAYAIQDWRSNERVLLKRNDAYWGEAPKMQRIIWRHIPESQSQRLMIEKGDLDIAFQLSPADLKALEANPDVTVSTTPSTGFYYLGVSMKDEKFSKPKVREALRYLIDYQGLNNAVLPYFGHLHQRPINSGLPGLLPDPGYELDPAKAKALLAEAGYPDGFKTTLRAIADEPFLNLATALQASLAKAGIEAEVITGSGDLIYGAMRERKFEMIVGRGGGGQIPHADSNLRALVYNPDNADEAKLTNFQGWRTSFFDAGINQMIDAAALESEPAEQADLYGEIQDKLEEVVHPIRPFSEVVTSVAFRKDVTGLVVSPSWSVDLGTVGKDR